jgi:hypothetical protein
MECDSNPKSDKAPRALANTVTVTTTPMGGGGGGMSGQLKIEAEIGLDPGWYTTAVELYSREGTQSPQWIGSMYYESTNGLGNEIYSAYVYEQSGGPATTYLVEVDLMRYQTERIAGST